MFYVSVPFAKFCMSHGLLICKTAGVTGHQTAGRMPCQSQGDVSDLCVLPSAAAVLLLWSFGKKKMHIQGDIFCWMLQHCVAGGLRSTEELHWRERQACWSLKVMPVQCPYGNLGEPGQTLLRTWPLLHDLCWSLRSQLWCYSHL